MIRRFFFQAAFLTLCQATDFHFVILGDRTGEAQPGIYEQVWKATAEENPAFVITVGDTIQGLDDKTAETEWREAQRIFGKQLSLYLTPGNHDIWSDLSEKLFRKYSGHPPHYSFDHDQAHFTILDNSRADQFSAAELAFLESDLKAHEKQPLKFVISHRPSWMLDILLKTRRTPSINSRKNTASNTSSPAISIRWSTPTSKASRTSPCPVPEAICEPP